ncbi:MAG: hypothetical protein ACR2IJ_10240, partial [Fluviibacter sp.]
MNELQLSLLGLGVFAIVLVVVYNRWVEHKHRKLNAPPPAEVVAEVVADETATDRQEPVWDHGEADMTKSAIDLPTEPIMSESPGAVEPIAALTEVESWVDAIASLRFYEPRTAGSIRDTLSQMGAERFERVEFYSGDGWHRAEALPDAAVVSNLRARKQL